MSTKYKYKPCFFLSYIENGFYLYDEHGNMLTMPHLSSMLWNEKDELISATNGTFVSYYNYDNQGNRTRKVVVKNNVREERYYVAGFEVFKKYVSDVLDFERKTINISDDEKVFARIEQKDNESEITRYQYDNHLGSACLELDENGDIISYEEYHPFGTTSYRSGRSEVEVYAYGMRYYAAWLCRFVSADPLQFKYPELTPFQYASNRCISGVDLDGAEYLSVTNPDINCQQDNEDGTYSITLGDVEFTGITQVSFNENKYYNLKQHMYYGSEGWSTEGKESNKVTEWIYNPVEETVSPNDFIKWKSNLVTGTYWSETKEKYLPKNENCYYLAIAQIKKGGAILSGKGIQIYKHNDKAKTTTISENYSTAIDYIHTQLELGKPVMVGVDYDVNKSPNTDGTDHFITIVNRGFDETTGEVYFLFYENAVVSKENVTSDLNRLFPNSSTNQILGKSPHWYNTKYTLTKILKNK